MTSTGIAGSQGSFGFPGDSDGKEFAVMWETQVWSLVQGDSLEKEITTYYSIFALKIPWTEEPGRLQPMESPKCQTWLSS